jgi:hypothetical protein
MGPIGPADYDPWRLHFGQTVIGSGTEVADIAVPKPACGGLAVLLMLSLGLKRGRLRSGRQLVYNKRLQ